MESILRTLILETAEGAPRCPHMNQCFCYGLVSAIVSSWANDDMSVYAMAANDVHHGSDRGFIAPVGGFKGGLRPNC